ncbi:hypothetical protein [Aeromonas veronii]
MDKISLQYDVSDLAKFMRKAKDGNKPFVFSLVLVAQLQQEFLLQKD